MKILLRLIFIGFIYFISFNCSGQGYVLPATDTSKTYNIELNDGQIIIGKILSRDSSSIVVEGSSLGVVTLTTNNIKSIKVKYTGLYKISLTDGSVLIATIAESYPEKIIVSNRSIDRLEIKRTNIESLEKLEGGEIHGNQYWFPNPNPTRYFFGPSAFTLKQGEGYYQNTYLVLNSFNVGVTDFFTLGGGIEFLTTFSRESSGPTFFLTPKFGFKVANKFHTGAGLFYVNASGGKGQREGFGIAYSISTYGTPDNNVSAGFGWGFTGEDLSDVPAVTISAMGRISKRTALVTENWFIFNSAGSENYDIYSYGLRVFGDKTSVDLGFINNIDISEIIFIGVPYVDFVVKF